MYPSYKETAINALLGEFVRLVSRQADKAIFYDEMVALRADFTSPVYFSSRTIIDIARMLKEMPTPPGWRKEDIQAVYELAAKAEQHESDCKEHLTHVMMRLLHELTDYDCGLLPCKIDKEKNVMTVFLESEFSHTPVLPVLGDVVTMTGDGMHYAVTAATLRFDEKEEDWILTFAARSLADGKETELPGDAVDESVKKAVADYMIEEARKDPGFESPLEEIGGGRWIAPRKGLVEVDGTKIRTAITQITSANILTVEVGTTGYCGGDSGHGGRTYLRITDDSCTDMRCRVNGWRQHGTKSVDIGKGKKIDVPSGDDETFETPDAHEVEIILGGDCEMETFTTALRFAADVLEKKAGGSLILEVPKDLEGKEDDA